MRLSKLVVILASFALPLILTPKHTRACSCSEVPLTDRELVEGQFSAATVVFEGGVIRTAQEVIAPTQYKPGLSAILFRVIRPYKGSVGESVEIYDDDAGTDCGFRPPLGEKYFVYGFHSGRTE